MDSVVAWAASKASSHTHSAPAHCRTAAYATTAEAPEQLPWLRTAGAAPAVKVMRCNGTSADATEGARASMGLVAQRPNNNPLRVWTTPPGLTPSGLTTTPPGLNNPPIPLSGISEETVKLRIPIASHLCCERKDPLRIRSALRTENVYRSSSVQERTTFGDFGGSQLGARISFCFAQQFSTSGSSLWHVVEENLEEQTSSYQVLHSVWQLVLRITTFV